ncbi:AAA family ATPase [Pseudomonas izuensis]|uniref:ATP-binding protein n=1 Tax=Pseudomonas izuensis TaxID=2684212 RepID=A0ABM7RRG2_9PSED|nr:AAA family ATPase [Pseudomonas izuensis]BCX67946.1 ATP-binding protein [Pseudomonas izuensis]
MIEGCLFNGVQLKFHDNENLTDNIYTTIVGRNGSGKSRLLRSLINALTPPGLFEETATVEPIKVSSSFEGKVPRKVIAVSTSPFDKFPFERMTIAREMNLRAGYCYLGLKGIMNDNLGLGYLSQIIGALMRAMRTDPSNALSVVRTLSYLGYDQKIQAEFHLVSKLSGLKKIINSPEPVAQLEEYIKNIINYKIRRAVSNKKTRHAVLEKILLCMQQYDSKHEKATISVELSSEGVIDANNREPLDEYFHYLHAMGLLRLRDVTLEKNNKKIKIKDASSGEQCVVMTMLGIASQIEDGSLICIDEPEVCLHPEWQERYIELLMSMFSRFKRCHFVIATHSPQIVAKLGNENCFVLDLENNVLSAAELMNKRSADFQLANVFHTPGFKNEYLSREVLSALSTLGSGLPLSDERVEILNRLISLKVKLERDDPVLRLISLLESALLRVKGD